MFSSTGGTSSHLGHQPFHLFFSTGFDETEADRRSQASRDFDPMAPTMCPPTPPSPTPACRCSSPEQSEWNRFFERTTSEQSNGRPIQRNEGMRRCINQSTRSGESLDIVSVTTASAAAVVAFAVSLVPRDGSLCFIPPSMCVCVLNERNVCLKPRRLDDPETEGVDHTTGRRLFLPCISEVNCAAAVAAAAMSSLDE